MGVGPGITGWLGVASVPGVARVAGDAGVTTVLAGAGVVAISDVAAGAGDGVTVGAFDAGLLHAAKPSQPAINPAPIATRQPKFSKRMRCIASWMDSRVVRQRHVHHSLRHIPMTTKPTLVK